jgi:hemerythrin
MPARPVAGLLRWGDHYSLGISEIDQQHRGLIQLLNRLDAEFRAGAPPVVLSVTLRHVVAETEAHFRTEEELMTDHAYPELDSHKAEHDILIKQVKEFAADFDAGRSELTESMLMYLKDWLRNHLLIADKRLGRFLRPLRRTC